MPYEDKPLFSFCVVEISLCNKEILKMPNVLNDALQSNDTAVLMKTIGYVAKAREASQIAEPQSVYVADPNPYKVSPPCRYNHRALVAYAEKMGKSINDLSLEEKAQFVED